MARATSFPESVMDQNEDLVAALAGRYDIEREVGRGGMAVVYLAHDIKHVRSVALKVLSPELATSLGPERFLREIAITASLVHPNILALYDSGEASGFLYYVMPYVDGPTLGQRLKREVQLPLDDVLAIARQVAAALDHAHARGVIHRDIKPDNILLLGDHVLVGDFGLARAISSAASTPLTYSGVVVGTVPYMSPEQCTPGRAVDGRSDIYSLGCVVFEMITGVPPFRGATPDATMSHHLTSDPPSLRTERRSCPSTLDDVVRRALAKAPADRFSTAGEFVRALESPRPIPVPPAVTPGRSFARRLALGVGAGAAALAAILTVLAAVEALPRIRDLIVGSTMDTTRLALLPLEREGSNVPPWRDNDLLQQALARWRGIGIVDQFQVADALRRRGVIQNSDDAAAIASSLGAGRYIRGRVTSLGKESRASLSLYDASRKEALYQVAGNVPNEIEAATIVYARLADSLLLRGAAADSVPSTAAGSRSLPAVQAFSRAQTALDDWDLTRADSGFQAATIFDPEYARASLWLAQVRAWQGLPPPTWGTIAERASAMMDQLNDREKSLVRSLVLLANRSYGAACANYERLLQRNDRDFSAWFGLGQCQMMDKIVIPDKSSPSGWRFRSNATRAMNAYKRAFEILPSVHRGYERGAFERLQVLLLVSTQLVTGFGVTDSAVFYARPGLVRDTFVLVPYPWQRVFSGSPDAIPPGFDGALAQRRSEFLKISAGWSAAFPRSPAAKQAVAVALELLGDVAAIDTLRAARALASDAMRQSQLRAAEIRVRVKFGLPDDLGSLHVARALADSLLSGGTTATSAEADLLAPLAALTGRCERTVSLARRLNPPSGTGRTPLKVITDAQALLAHVALGCPIVPPTKDVSELAIEIASAFPARQSDDRRRVEQMWLSRPALLSATVEQGVLNRLAEISDSKLLHAARAFVQRDTATVRATLLAFSAGWHPDIVVTPDVALPGARLLAAVGDTGTAIKWLDRSLTDLRRYDAHLLADDFARVASLMKALQLRADLAFATKDRVSARRFGAAAAALWSDADAALQPEAQRMARYAILR